MVFQILGGNRTFGSNRNEVSHVHCLNMYSMIDHDTYFSVMDIVSLSVYAYVIQNSGYLHTSRASSRGKHTSIKYVTYSNQNKYDMGICVTVCGLHWDKQIHVITCH